MSCQKVVNKDKKTMGRVTLTYWLICNLKTLGSLFRGLFRLRRKMNVLSLKFRRRGSLSKNSKERSTLMRTFKAVTILGKVGKSLQTYKIKFKTNLRRTNKFMNQLTLRVVKIANILPKELLIHALGDCNTNKHSKKKRMSKRLTIRVFSETLCHGLNLLRSKEILRWKICMINILKSSISILFKMVSMLSSLSQGKELRLRSTTSLMICSEATWTTTWASCEKIIWLSSSG